MPPKITRAEKQARIVSHLRATRTCHTLKELEKMLPAVASINGLQVKEYIQELVDEGQIRGEKIGTVNWYWCFASEEHQARERRVQQLQTEVDHARRNYEDVKAQLAVKKREREQAERDHGDEAGEREALLREKTELERECQALRLRLATVSPSEIEMKSAQVMQEEVKGFREQVQMWTENIYVLEGYLKKLAGGDREIIEAVQRECYGEEYAEGEGLREYSEESS